MSRFYNTLTKKKEEFHTLNPGKVGMYVCGPTVYDYIHIGNLRTWVFADTLRRILEDEGYEVRMIKNITDVGHMTADDTGQGDSGEDKMLVKAAKEKKTPEEIALFYETYFHSTEKALGILPAHYFPQATKHIEAMIRLITVLIEKGHAYESNGNVFYAVESFQKYGELSGNTLAGLEVGARLEEHPDKKNPWDFALWLKAPDKHLMRWVSPWSEGYPGWHIECSAMSMEYLGDTLDIHTGGEDNIFPHHEAEIAQSEGVTGKAFSRYWLHSRHILIEGKRMSKSSGNYLTLESIQEKGFDAADLRMLFLSAHYRSQMNFTWDSLTQAKKNRESLRQTKKRLLRGEILMSKEGFRGDEEFESIREALRDDLNTPLALTHTLELCRTINTALDQGTPLDKDRLQVILTSVSTFFGLPEETLEDTLPEEIEKLAKERQMARDEKNFGVADSLRETLESLGYQVEDTVMGQVVTKK